MAYTIGELARGMGGELHQNRESTIVHLAIDSRKIFDPRQTIFFALEGDRHDGDDYIDELWRKGVGNFVVRRLPRDIDRYTDANFVRVDSTLGALQQLAADHRGRFNYPVIGITGSNGKTIVKEWIYHLMAGKRRLVRSPKSYNSQVGVPLSVWNMAEGFDYDNYYKGKTVNNDLESYFFVNS